MSIVTNDNITNLFDWANINNDIEGMKLFSMYDRASVAAKGSMSDWVWRMAYEEQHEKDVKSPLDRKQTVADNFTKRLQTACDWVSSEVAGEYRLDLARVKLTGNGGVAGAYKKIHTAILNKLDLKEFRSASACQTENTKISKLNAEADVAKNRRTEAELDAKDSGFEEGSEAFEEEVDRIVQEMIRKASAEATANNPPIPGGSSNASDKFDLMGQEVAAVLRLFHEQKTKEFASDESKAGMADSNVNDQLEAMLNRITKLCESSALALAGASGLIEDDNVNAA